MLDHTEVTDFFDASAGERPLLPDPTTAGGWGKLVKYQHAVATVHRTGARRILDLGCNIGHVAALLNQSDRPGLRSFVIGVDLSLRALQRAQSQAFPAAAFAAAMGERLPFPDAVFDLVISLDVLEHVADPAALLAEAHRVLRPGGTLLLTTPNPRGIASYAGYRLRRALRRLAGRPEADKDAFLTAADLARHAAAAGFTSNAPSYFLPRPFIVLRGWALTPPLPPALALRYQRFWVRRLGLFAQRLPRPLRQPLTHTLLLETQRRPPE